MCASIIRALIKHKKLDEQEIATICMLPEKICRSRKPDHSTQTTIYLFTMNLEYTVKNIIDFIYVIILNLRSRQKVVVMKHAVRIKRGNEE